MSELTAQQASQLSREEALRIMATADGVGAREKHLAELMLEGPAISPAEERRLNDWRPMLPPVSMAVRLALRAWNR